MALADIHLAPGAPEGAPGAVLVRGSYDFYHFGCQGLDDRGWGCAYRSLQKIASWALRAERGPARFYTGCNSKEGWAEAAVAAGLEPPSARGGRRRGRRTRALSRRRRTRALN